MKKLVPITILHLLLGCSTVGNITNSISWKNLDLSGCMMHIEAETTNTETMTPEVKIIIGKVTYKSRKVGIPANQKVPTTGYFKATKTVSLFGVEDTVIEYDFTAGSDEDARKAEEILKKRKEEAEKLFNQPKN